MDLYLPVLLFLGGECIPPHQQPFGAVESDAVRALRFGEADLFSKLNVRDQLDLFSVKRLRGQIP